MATYYEDHDYITEVKMEQLWEIERLPERQEEYDDIIYGYVIGKANVALEHEWGLPSNLPDVQFRKLIKKEDYTDDYLSDLEIDNDEFVGIIYVSGTEYKAPRDGAFYLTLYIDKRDMQIGNWYFN